MENIKTFLRQKENWNWEQKEQVKYSRKWVQIEKKIRKNQTQSPGLPQNSRENKRNSLKSKIKLNIKCKFR
jgi:hypothetical protein